MNPIAENPYRILGCLAGCSEKDLLRQIAKISRYADIGKTVEFDCDFSFLGEMKRDLDTVKEASSRLEQAARKVHWALFWFLEANHIDEAALNHLKEGNQQKAADIWSLPITGKEITSKNYSAAINYSTLQLFTSTKSNDLDTALLKKAIRLKGNVLCSDAFDDFVELVIREKQNGIREGVIKEFVDETLQLVKPFLDKPSGIPTPQLISAFARFPVEITSYLKNKFTAPQVRRVEREIETARKRMSNKPTEAANIGTVLFQKTLDDLKSIGTILGVRSVQFQTLNNKVVEEILQCSITYFNKFHDSDDVDPGLIALELLRLARAMDPTGEVQHRLEENAPTIEEYVEDEPERHKQRLVRSDVEYIKSLLDGFQELAAETSNAGKFLEQAKPMLQKIGNVLGRSDEFYLMLSNAVVENAIGMVVSVVNEKQEKCDPSSLHGNQYDTVHIMLIRNRIGELGEAVKRAHRVMRYAESFDMGTDQRQRFRRNKEALEGIMGNLDIPLPQDPPVYRPQTPSFRSGPSEGRQGGTRRPETKRTDSSGKARVREYTFGGYLGKKSAGLVGFVSKNPGWAGIISLVLILSVIGLISSLSESPSPGSANASGIPDGLKPPPGMVYVPAGHLLSKAATMKGFFMDVYEVTILQYGEFLAATNHPRPAAWNAMPAARAKFPVVGMTWEDANAFAKWKGKRLPTEEEWEFAARGNETRAYPWGKDWIPGYSNANNSMKTFTQVGAFPLGASINGIHDLSGNAWEWTTSDFKEGPGANLPSEFRGSKNLKTLRGGAFSSKAEDATAVSRLGWPAVGAKDYSLIGFRCVKDVESPGK